MWRVEYLNVKTGLRMFRNEEFFTRKQARHWCRNCGHGKDFELHGPNGLVEKFVPGVQ